MRAAVLSELESVSVAVVTGNRATGRRSESRLQSIVERLRGDDVNASCRSPEIVAVVAVVVGAVADEIVAGADVAKFRGETISVPAARSGAVGAIIEIAVGVAIEDEIV